MLKLLRRFFCRHEFGEIASRDETLALGQMLTLWADCAKCGTHVYVSGGQPDRKADLERRLAARSALVDSFRRQLWHQSRDWWRFL